VKKNGIQFGGENIENFLVKLLKLKKKKNHFHFDSFFIACAQTIVMHHQQSFLIPLMLISYY